MNEIKSTKNILAKLLATENITVCHLNVKDSSFDLKTRTLICPVWKEMDGDLYDLLIGREIGHALETPVDGIEKAMWHPTSKERMPDEFADYLRVLEDARIEKKIKRRYPGLAKSFSNAYKELHNKDFFGLNSLDLNELILIDRINVYSKLGSFVYVNWKNDWERDIILEVSKLETWDQVVELAHKLFQSEDGQEEQSSADDDIGGVDLQEDFVEEVVDQVEGEEETEDEIAEAIEVQLESAETEQQEDSELIQVEISVIETTENETIEHKLPVTVKNFESKQKELVSETARTYFLNLPEPKMENIILSNSEVMNDLGEFIRKQTQEINEESYEELSANSVNKFNERNRSFVMNLYKEFDMRKRAQEYMRTRVARTGELDMNKLHQYRYSSDLFKKTAVVEKGKSHGLIIFLDMSESIQNMYRNIVEQVLVLASFCKLANIPFDVYGFSNTVYKNKFTHRNSRFESNELTEMHFQHSLHFHLKHLLGSSLPKSQYKDSFNNLCIFTEKYNTHANPKDESNFPYDWSEAGFGMSGTPYCETLLASRQIIKEFKRKNKLDIVNVIYLTDGDGNTRMSYPKSFTEQMISASTFYFVDKKTQTKILLQNGQQTTLTNLVKDLTQCKHIGFYFVSRRGLFDVIHNLEASSESTKKIEDMRTSARNNNFFSSNLIGYDKYFYVSSSNKNLSTGNLEIDPEMDQEEMSEAFTKFGNNKKNSRILVSKFVEEIAIPYV